MPAGGESSLNSVLVKVGAGFVALVGALFITTVFVGPIPLFSDALNRIASSVGLGASCGNESIKSAVVKLIKERMPNPGASSATWTISSVAKSGSKGDLQECRGILSVSFSPEVTSRISETFKLSDSFRMSIGLIWNPSQREVSLPIDYQVGGDAVFIPGTTLIGLGPLEALVRIAGEYITKEEKLERDAAALDAAMRLPDEPSPPSKASFTNDLSFPDYPAEVYQGSVTLPDFSGTAKTFAQYRTRISEAVQTGANFSGTMAVVEFGCGSGGCREGYATNVQTGEVYRLPVGGGEDMYLSLIYKPDSSLLQAQWQEGSSDRPICTRAFYQWTGSQFTALQKRDAAGECPEVR